MATTTNGNTTTDVVTSTSSSSSTPPAVSNNSNNSIVPADPNDDATLPAICFTTCNNAYLSASSTGLIPTLCDPSSLFSSALASCKSCIAANSPSPTAVIDAYITPRFAPYINYCAASFSQTLLFPAPTTVATIPELASASLESKWSSVAAIASSGGYFVVPTELLIVTTETKRWVSTGSDGVVRTEEQTRTTTIPNLSAWNYTLPGGGPAPPVPVTSPPGGGGFGVDDNGGGIGQLQSGNAAWVAGPIVGCVAGIAMIASAGLVWMRRRKRRRRESEDGGRGRGDQSAEDPLGKAQLHSECVPRPMTPREMDGGRKTFWQLDEMAANEIPAAELPGDEVYWVEDEKVGMKGRPESGSSVSTSTFLKDS